MALEEMRCRICRSPRLRPHFWPSNEYLGQRFSFHVCEDCCSLSVYPMPDQEVLETIYGDLYQPPADETAGTEPAFVLAAHQQIALEFLQQSAPLLEGCRDLLDFGCSNGYYMVAARKLGLDPGGVEFSAAVARRVAERVVAPVFDAAEFRSRFLGRSFDVIHVSHLLEHVADPLALLERLKAHAHAETRFVIDGPVEVNRYLGRIVVDAVSRIQRRSVHHGIMPMHVSFTSTSSQKLFFENAGLRLLRFALAEQAYPLPRPNQIDWRSPRSICLVALAQVSIVVSRFLPGWGNLFHCVAVLDRAVPRDWNGRGRNG